MKLKIVTAALAASFIFSAQPANAGGMTGGATEVTQMMNNIELMFQSVQDAENLLTTINQYTTMLQNLQQLPAQVVSQTLGENFGELGKKIETFQKVAMVVSQVQQSSLALGNALKTASNAADKLNMTPAQFAKIAIDQAQNQNTYFQEQIRTASNAAESVQRDSKALQAVANEIGSSGAGDAGIVRAVGNLTQSSIINAQIASEVKAQLAQLSQMEAVKGQASEEDERLARAKREVWVDGVRQKLGTQGKY